MCDLPIKKSKSTEPLKDAYFAHEFHDNKTLKN